MLALIAGLQGSQVIRQTGTHGGKTADAEKQTEVVLARFVSVNILGESHTQGCMERWRRSIDVHRGGPTPMPHLVCAFG